MAQAVIPLKIQLVAGLGAHRDALLQFCDALTDLQRTAPLTPDGWNVQDFVGHLSYWEQYGLASIGEILKHGHATSFPPNSFEDDINGQAMLQRKAWTWQRVRAEFDNTRSALIQRVNGLSESDLQFYSPSPWLNDARIISIEMMIRDDLLKHGQEHLSELIEKTHDHH